MILSHCLQAISVRTNRTEPTCLRTALPMSQIVSAVIKPPETLSIRLQVTPIRKEYHRIMIRLLLS